MTDSPGRIITEDALEEALATLALFSEQADIEGRDRDSIARVRDLLWDLLEETS